MNIQMMMTEAIYRAKRVELSKAEKIIHTDFVLFGYELCLLKLISLLQGEMTKF